MEIYIGFFVSFCLLLFSVLKGLYIGYAILACWLIFVILAVRKGYPLKEIGRMSYRGGKKSYIVLVILLLIGAVIGIWMSAGTIPAIVYYCLKFINPSFFLISAFLICCVTSFLLGSSLGTVSTVGIPLMILARSGNIPLDIVAGAVIAGAYFGDRCSPMSSSAALVASLTKTNIFTNIRNMLLSSILPFILASGFYFALSMAQPLKAVNNDLPGELMQTFGVQWFLLLPAVIILVLSLCKVKIHISIPISILSAVILSMLYRHQSLPEVLQDILLGFRTGDGSPLQNIIKGGGLVSMLKPCLVVYVSCSLAGIFEGIHVFDSFKKTLAGMQLTRHKLFGVTSLVSIATAAFGCNQTISAVMTAGIMKDCYPEPEKNRFALDLENSGILIAALIPWNIAALVPTTTMNVSMAGYLPYAFYLYILPVTYFIVTKVRGHSQNAGNLRRT